MTTPHAKKAFEARYEQHEQSQKGDDSKIFDTVHVAMDVLSWDAYMRAHNETHPDIKPFDREFVERVSATVVN